MYKIVNISKRSLKLAAIGGGLVLCGPLQAHHSVAAYDFNKTVQLKGTVKVFQWTNPHCWIELAVTDSQGRSGNWTLESGTPNVNKRMGWTGTDVKPGDKVDVVIHPKRDGSSAGALMTIRLANGKTLMAPGSLFGKAGQ
ncbi:hypothetical protein WSK_4046 [Novosphingobium sp. Rr 2-17]|uniref:DUF6152 family protein n=1 Tax=Novosphingobium sp. Rr 2-17 TaxID=555793 RepID=UPI0002699C19|nr:DUF6152 family protein [Novosphingobium sp. Rr 2-17]EIZ77384.1 hypothetical protein WSK_4046 [Novosphingobium sp. Rr 2-17]